VAVVSLVGLLAEALVFGVFALPQPQSTAVIAMAMHKSVAFALRRPLTKARNLARLISVTSPRS
jgi:hypothetical protein